MFVLKLSGIQTILQYIKDEDLYVIVSLMMPKTSTLCLYQ